MTLSLAFWILMLIWFVWSLPLNTWSASAPYAGPVLLFCLFLLLGWRVFGAPLHG